MSRDVCPANTLENVRNGLVRILYVILHVLVSIANLRITEDQLGLKKAPRSVPASITKYPGLAQGQYEGMTIWIPSKPTRM
jgi:hypothetical protein